MQALIDFIPLLLALLVYQQYDIYAATIVLMVTLPMIPIGQKLLGKPVSQVHVWSAGLVLIFGTATLVLKDPRFVKMKPTILYAGLAAAFLCAQRFGGVNLAKKILGGAITLEAPQWQRLSHYWAGFFVFLAALNTYVALNFSEATWFQFKVWGLTGLTLVFVVAQSVWIAGYMHDGAGPDNPKEGDES